AAPHQPAGFVASRSERNTARALVGPARLGVPFRPMIPGKIDEALRSLGAWLEREESAGDVLGGYWESRGRELGEALPPATIEAADVVDKGLPALTRASSSVERLGPAFDDARGKVVFLWCAASVSRTDVRLAPLLAF